MYEGITKGDNGYDEYTNTGDIAVINANETAEIDIYDGWFVEVHEPTHIVLSLLGPVTSQPPEKPIETPNEEPVTPDEPEEPTETAPTGIRPDVKKAIDAYESFIDTYCEFMENYDSSDAMQLMRYASLMAEYASATEKFDALSKDLTNEENRYYLEVLNRCNYKLGQAAIAIG